MPTQLIDWEVSSPFSLLHIAPQYSRVCLLVRCFGSPIDRVTLPVSKGRIEAAAIEAALSDRARDYRQQMMMRQALGSEERTSGRPLPSATVAVCTRDRTEDLRRCLDGILRLRGPNHEILVIDNCPSRETTAQLMAGYPTVRYVREPAPGLNHARNRALREATGEIVAFIDDDAVPDADWLEAHLTNYTQPIVLCVTGLTVPLELEHPSQEEFECYSSFVRGFERKVFDPLHHDPLRPGPIGAGVNMSVRRSIIETVGGFDNALDAGTQTRSGGDHEMFTRILGAGYRIVYEPQAINRHRHRNSPHELEKAIEGYGVGSYAAMTRALLVDGEFGVFRIAWLWLRHSQAKAILSAILRREPAIDRRLIKAEIRGCLKGPFAYLRSVANLRRKKLARYG